MATREFGDFPEMEERVLASIRDRMSHGLAKYGPMRPDKHQWLEELQQELLDACVYLQAYKDSEDDLSAQAKDAHIQAAAQHDADLSKIHVLEDRIQSMADYVGLLNKSRRSLAEVPVDDGIGLTNQPAGYQAGYRDAILDYVGNQDSFWNEVRSLRGT